MDQRRFDNQRSDFVTARQAADALNVKLSTIYAYASRGRLRSIETERGRQRLYARDDVERLRAGSRARAGHGAVAATALRWGEPVLESAITRITEAGQHYRGVPATELARAGASFESVAELLISGRLPEGGAHWRAERPSGSSVTRLRALASKEPSSISTLTAVVAALALTDPARHGASIEADLQRTRSVMRWLAAAPALGGRHQGAFRAALGARLMSESVALAFGKRPSRRVLRAVERALVLCADHELNASTFSARVAASAGADLYACIGAALGTLSGVRHGGMTERVEALVDEIGSPGRVEQAIHERLRRGSRIPGFGHPFYRTADPRAAPLFEVAFEGRRSIRRLQTLRELVRVMQSTGRGPATIDVGLVAVRTAIGLPRGAAAALFAIGRTAGWVAHIFEQRQAGFLLRPRARYVGP